MKIYLSHASGYDYENKLYKPLKGTFAGEHEFFFPHDERPEGVNAREALPSYDVMLAEVSYPSTGQGIELGRAESAGVPIVCFYRAGSRISSSLRFVSDTIVEYVDNDDMISKIDAVLKEM